MTLKVQHKRSAVSGKAPLPADLDFGEIAVNYHASGPAIYVKDTAGAIRKIGSLTGALVFKGSKAPGDAAPGTPASGDIWVMSAAGTMAASWIGVAGLAVVKDETIAWDGSEWISLGTDPPTADATETVKGIAEIATTAEVNAGTDDTRFVTPAKLQAYVTDQLKATWLPGDHIGASDIGTSTWNGPADTLVATGGVEVKIATGAWGAGGAVAPANQVQVRWIASAVAAAAHAATLTGRVENASGSVGVDYNLTIDKLPTSDITINAKPGAAAGAVSESDSSTAVHGINAAVRLWLDSSDGTTPEVSIAGGAWTAVPATAAAGLAVAAGETFKLRHTTKAGASTVTTTTVRVGWDATSSVTASYASTNVATKAPDVGAVTLADVAGGARFTSVAFPVSATMTEDGIPTSTKKLKAYVEGSLKSAAQTSGIASVAGNVLTLTDNTQLANFAAGEAVTEVGGGGDATGTVGSVDATANTITLATSAGTWDVGSAVKGPLKTINKQPNSDVITAVNTSGAQPVLTFASDKELTDFASGDAITQENSSGTPIYSDWVTTDDPGGFGNPITQVFDGNINTIGSAYSGAYNLFITPPAGTTLQATTSFETYINASHAGRDNTWKIGPVTASANGATVGAWLSMPALVGQTITSTTPLIVQGKSTSVPVIAAIRIDGTILVDGTGIEPRGTVGSVDVTAKTMTLATSTGTWGPASAGHHVIGPSKPASNVKLYCKLDAAGAVSDLQSADPGFTAWTPAGTGPYTGTVTFPATLPTGSPPDTDLPAGTTVTVEVEASNTAGSDSAKSNTVTPA